MYTPINQFYYIKAGFNEVKIIQVCFRDAGSALTLCSFKANSTRRFILSHVSHFDLMHFSHFSIATTSLGDKRYDLCVFRVFVCFASVGLRFFPLDVLSLKNTKFAEYLEFIYPRELEIKETTETSASSSYLDCYLYIDNGKLTTRLYDKRDDFNFPIVNFPFLSSNIPSAPAYGVYVSQLIRYARTCSNYQDFMERGKVLTQKLLSQGYQKTKLVATLKKFYGRHHDLVNPYNVAVSRIVSDVFASDAP